MGPHALGAHGPVPDVPRCHGRNRCGHSEEQQGLRLMVIYCDGVFLSVCCIQCRRVVRNLEPDCWCSRPLQVNRHRQVKAPNCATQQT